MVSLVNPGFSEIAGAFHQVVKGFTGPPMAQDKGGSLTLFQ
ncbi:MAG TPA: hypothetical protein VG055_19075 [Planctomycetaceae bacterium]|jgi:hypothetical protein|nr:hypothetical protein [Planctomycetaceae bacterium]